MDQTFPKQEHLCGSAAVAQLMSSGKTLSEGCLRCKYLRRTGDEGPVRMLVSVPKRLFKRAVRRNLLKRRIRESYRRQKGNLPAGLDLMLVYTSAEVLPYAEIDAHLRALVEKLAHA